MAIYITNKPLILASHSPRRKQFLEELGLNFSIMAADIDESVLPGEKPRKYVERMAYEKTRVIMEENPDSWVIGADTAVCLDDLIFGKPENDNQAVEMLMALSGRVHTVRGGVCLGLGGGGSVTVQSVSTRVKFFSFSEQVAASYVAEGESADKAGAYGIQGKGGFLVERIEGSYSNVVGLPLAELIAMLTEKEVIGIR